MSTETWKESERVRLLRADLDTLLDRLECLQRERLDTEKRIGQVRASISLARHALDNALRYGDGE